MDGSNDALAQAIIEQEQMKRDGVKAFIEDVSQGLLRNDSWDTFKPDEIAEASLQVAAGKTDSSTEDKQTHRFRQFLSIATNFSSLPFAQKLHKIPELVESIKELLENMMKEVQEYSDMANELRDLIQCFVRMVTQAKHNVNMMLPLLKAAKSQMGIVQDVMSTDPSKALNGIDKRDIQLALNRMSSGIQSLLDLAKSATAESQKLDDRIHNMTNSVQSKKVTVEERLDVANFCFKCAVPVSTITSGAAVGGLVAAELFGGVGALIIAGTAFPPITAIISACILGGACAGTVILLVKKFWARHQLKALNYLNQIFEGLVELSSANAHFMRYMADTEEKANTVSQHIQDIQLCLESERQRRANHNVCDVAIDSTTSMIESLERISNLDISKWSDTSNVISFSKTKMITYAITK
ncbi:unnamed protein product [Rotaria sp. Silwood1]|nr:unnamed protein product [Rotaria sp. Silwood1]CAF4770535.1 unnamed protein product [Rotaria sp. Silwood1]